MKALISFITDFFYHLYLPIKTFVVHCYREDAEAKRVYHEYEEQHRKELMKKNLKINLMKEIFK